jgi:DNA polymerase I-like protein with 3'-5' exonuclease and polymerase domains/uracil-DNA glycosylase
MIVGEAPGKEDAMRGEPFIGASGYELNRLLKEAGFGREQFFLTNVLRERPPNDDPEAFIATTVCERAAAPGKFTELNGKWVDERILFGRDLLHKEVQLCKPTLVVAFGDLALWALTGHWGIRKWRGSVLQGRVGEHEFKVLPTIHPQAVLREWKIRRMVVHDIRRAFGEWQLGPTVQSPDYRFIVAPTFEQAIATLDHIEDQLRASNGPYKLAADKETRGGHVACLGIAWSELEAICLPFMSVQAHGGYWTLEQETEILARIQRILRHPKAEVIWQNGSYDQQYAHRRHLYIPTLTRDTLINQHSIYSCSPKALDFLSSIYCKHHVYWKDDGKKWDPSIDERQYWKYNCTDAVRTYEIDTAQMAMVSELSKEWPELPSIVEFQNRLQNAVMRMMLRGVRSDDESRDRMSKALAKRIAELQSEINFLVGQELNPGSPKQMTDFFYNVLQFTPVYKTTRVKGAIKKSLTCDDDALEKFAVREPIARPLVARIHGIRSARVFKSTFVDMTRDEDGRIRSSYNVGGTIGYRFSSSENAFDSGGNLQNIPTGEDDGEWWESIVELPNIKQLFLPDAGKTWFDLDGDSADLRIVTWESDCRQMKAYFAAGVKPYVEVAKEFYRDPTITKQHPRYRTMKALCHATNYLGTPEGLAIRIGLPVHDIDRIQKWYFGMCPEIKAWHEDIKAQVDKRGWVRNPFGYRVYYWDRVTSKTYGEAVAIVPQSGVACWVNRILAVVDADHEAGLTDVELLLQVHDSLDGQFPTESLPIAVPYLKTVAAGVKIPCRSGELVIPAGVKTSTRSWGDCE